MKTRWLAAAFVAASLAALPPSQADVDRQESGPVPPESGKDGSLAETPRAYYLREVKNKLAVVGKQLVPVRPVPVVLSVMITGSTGVGMADVSSFGWLDPSNLKCVVHFVRTNSLKIGRPILVTSRKPKMEYYAMPNGEKRYTLVLNETLPATFHEYTNAVQKGAVLAEP